MKDIPLHIGGFCLVVSIFLNLIISLREKDEIKNLKHQVSVLQQKSVVNK